ncbi:CAP domain-containing protein [Anatilimnocola sp. NA78]|uniref:CAP domain-containing protein n=1 Tax=Anatilimnocola sp. NA78 TaxID=3415683 RepID=UPI003CE58184
MKRLAWALVLVSTSVAAAQQAANTTVPNKTADAKATQESVGASGKDTQSQTKAKTVSATTSTPTTAAGKKEENLQAAKKQAKQPVILHQHPTMVTMLQRSNGIRGRIGLRNHRLNPALCAAAQNHAEYMAATGSFSHDTNGGYVERARRFGFRGGVRENIGWNYATIDHAFAGWQGSGGHYAAIVSGTTDAGFGYARSASGQTYWVSVYGAATAQDEANYQAVMMKDKERADAAEAAKEAATAEAEATEEATEKKQVETKPVSEEQPGA